MKSNIRKLRNERQISQTELANIIGKTQQTVSHMERDRDRIPIESLITLADYFGVSTDYILGIEDEETQRASKRNGGHSFQTEDLKENTEAVKNIANGGNAKLLYELVLSLLLCSLEENLQPASVNKEEYD